MWGIVMYINYQNITLPGEYHGDTILSSTIYVVVVDTKNLLLTVGTCRLSGATSEISELIN